jgi:hypothetical protein
MRKVFFVISLLLLASIAFADIPRYISIQGRLSDSSDIPLSGSYDLRFRFYDSYTGGNLLDTVTVNNVDVNNGLFDVQISPNLGFDQAYYVEVSVWNSSSSQWVVLSPRMNLTSVAYSYSAGRLLPTSSDVTAPRFVDYDDNSYYCDPSGMSKLSDVNVTGYLYTEEGALIRTKNWDGSIPWDSGIYSNDPSWWMRFVTNNADFRWFSDGGTGTNSIMALSPGGDLSVSGDISITTSGKNLSLAPAGSEGNIRNVDIIDGLNDIRFAVGGVEQMRIDNGFWPIFDNSLYLGLSGNRWKEIYGGSVIASSDVNASRFCLNGDCRSTWPAGGGAVADVWVNETGDTMTGDLKMSDSAVYLRNDGYHGIKWDYSTTGVDGPTIFGYNGVTIEKRDLSGRYSLANFTANGLAVGGNYLYLGNGNPRAYMYADTSNLILTLPGGNNEFQFKDKNGNVKASITSSGAGSFNYKDNANEYSLKAGGGILLKSYYDPASNPDSYITSTTSGGKIRFRNNADGVLYGWIGSDWYISGKLGVGTSSPTHKLDVNGDVRVRGGDVDIINLDLSDNGGQPQIRFYNTGSGKYTRMSRWTDRLELQTDDAFSVTNTVGGTPSIWVDAVNTRVGIGTSSPSYKLDVNGGIKSTGNINIDKSAAQIILGAGQGGPHGLRFGDTNTNGMQMLYRTTPDELRWEDRNDGSSGTVLMSLDRNGNLRVGDDIYSADGALVRSTDWSGSGPWDAGIYSNTSTQWVRFVTNNAPFKWFSDGGTGTNPIMTLEASGDLKVDGSIKFGGGWSADCNINTEGTMRYYWACYGTSYWSVLQICMRSGEDASGNPTFTWYTIKRYDWTGIYSCI